MCGVEVVLWSGGGCWLCGGEASAWRWFFCEVETCVCGVEEVSAWREEGVESR